jgi:hypothetical protein
MHQRNQFIQKSLYNFPLSRKRTPDKHFKMMTFSQGNC